MTQIWSNGIMMGVRSESEAREFAENMRKAGWYVVENWSNNFVSADEHAPKQKKNRRRN